MKLRTIILPCTILAGKITFHTINHSSVIVSILPAFGESLQVSKNLEKSLKNTVEEVTVS